MIGQYTKQKKKEERLSQNDLKSQLEYKKDFGLFISKVTWGKRYIGKRLGCRHKNGYTTISIHGGVYMAHRLAWLYEYGVWPNGDIDHIDGNKTNNALYNLRNVSRSENNFNQKLCSKNSKTGLLGVSRHKESGRYRATIYINYKQKCLGYFDTPEEAHQAYLTAKRELHSTCTI